VFLVPMAFLKRMRKDEGTRTKPAEDAATIKMLLVVALLRAEER
jgi:hypothetical protein